jgi:hypothetical protein
MLDVPEAEAARLLDELEAADGGARRAFGCDVVVSTTGSPGAPRQVGGNRLRESGLGSRDRGGCATNLWHQGLDPTQRLTGVALEWIHRHLLGLPLRELALSRTWTGRLTFWPFRASQGVGKENLLMDVSKLKAALGALALSTSLAAAPVWAAETVHHHHAHHHYHHHKCNCPHKKHHGHKHHHKAKKAT